MIINKPYCCHSELKRICKFHFDGNCNGNFACEKLVSEDRKFVEFFDELYGKGLEVANWHLNGNTESFDNLYEAAIEFSQKK